MTDEELMGHLTSEQEDSRDEIRKQRRLELRVKELEEIIGRIVYCLAGALKQRRFYLAAWWCGCLAMLGVDI